MVKFLEDFDCPQILEVGVDQGATLIPLLHTLIVKNKRFDITAVDIKFNDTLKEILTYIHRNEDQKLRLIEANSLEWLPKCESKFQLVLLDGDHNYHTVHQELTDIQKNLTRDAVMICDDYSGKWAERDLWYSTRPGYETNALASKATVTEKHGVKPAVDDFVKANPEWQLKTLMPGEPVVMFRDDEQSY
jgi:Methyltransferase domain